MFFGKKKKASALLVLAPMEGEVVKVGEVNDPTFSEEMLGKGLAIRPTGGRVVAPVDGEVTQMFDTGHAVSLTSKDGLEVLVHVGLDTIQLKGKHYTIHAHTGDKVKAGDLLMEFDKDAIAADGYDTITPIVICNSGDYSVVDTGLMVGKPVHELDEIASIQK